MLRGEPQTGRADEGTARGDDGVVAESYTGLVPEQEMQRQEEDDINEATDAAGKG